MQANYENYKNCQMDKDSFIHDTRFLLCCDSDESLF